MGWRRSLVFMIIMCLKTLLSSNLHHTSAEKVVCFSLVFVVCFSNTTYKYVPFIYMWYIKYICICTERYIYHIYYTQIFVFTAYIICAVILYRISVKGNSVPVLLPSWKFVAKTLHLCASSLLLQDWGWQLRAGHLLHLRTHLGHAKL